MTREEVERRVGAWIAHTAHANTRRLRRAIFRDRWFDPSRWPDRPPVGVCCAAAPGTTNRGGSVPPTATGTIPETGTTIPGSVLSVRSAAGAGVVTGTPCARVSVQGGHDERSPAASFAPPVLPPYTLPASPFPTIGDIVYTVKQPHPVMEKIVRKFASFAEEEEAEYAYYRELSGEQRLQILLELVMPENADAGTIERSVRVRPLVEREEGY